MKMRFAVATVLMMAAGAANAQMISGAPFLAVHGTAKQELVPDLFPLQLTLAETNLDTAATQERIESLASNVLAIADQMKVAESDLKISNLSISPEYKYDDEKEKEIFLGNTYKREIEIRFHSLSKLKEFISALPAAKQLRIDSEPFETSRIEELKQALLKVAIANARKTAEELAAGIGRKLGAVHTISNQGFNVRYSESADAFNRVPLARNAIALLAPGVMVMREGRMTIDQNVYIIYALD